MASVKDRPVPMHPLIKNAIGQVFPEFFLNHKTDTREEMKEEVREKPKKKRDDD